MALMLRCPLTGLTCDKPIVIQDKTFFLSEAEEPRSAMDRRHIAINEAVGKKYKMRSALVEKQQISFNCKICEMIQSCAYGIADITGQNPNVLLELGMMFALGKPTIILCKKSEEGKLKLPSNLNAIEVIPFEDYIDIIEDIRRILLIIPPPFSPPAPWEATVQMLIEANPKLAAEIKKTLADHKKDLVTEFAALVKEAKLETISSEKSHVAIPEGIEERLSAIEKSLNRSEGLGIPSDATTLLYRGNLYYERQEYEAAINQFNRALELKPDYADALSSRGVTYSKLERYDEALADCNRVLELKPDDALVLYNRGTSYSKLERYDEALPDYNRALELKPDYAEAFNNRGTTYIKLKRYDEALADYNRALELRPDYPDALYNLACLFSLTNKLDEAISHLKKAILLDQKNREMAATDSDFYNIRDDSRFRKLIEGV